jgi:hypothetical protein
MTWEFVSGKTVAARVRGYIRCSKGFIRGMLTLWDVILPTEGARCISGRNGREAPARPKAKAPSKLPPGQAVTEAAPQGALVGLSTPVMFHGSKAA